MTQQTGNPGVQSEGREAVLHSTSFASNAIHLSPREWAVAIAIVLAVLLATPAVWKQIVRFEPQADFRVPYDLSNDYWTYERFVDTAIGRDQTLVIGDSVVWGEYVDPRHTLSHYFNELHGASRFANGGVNGTHPLALEGLVRYYAKDVRDTQVLLHCNLLWMSSKDRDLQIDKEVAFNHPRLVPQFVPRVPSYKAPVDERLGVAIDHRVAYRKWVRHLRVAHFDSLDVHTWTLEHPYENPLGQIRLASPEPHNRAHSEPISWTQRGIQPQDIPWIDLDTSLQWQAFRSTVATLRGRGNRVFVILGPFNEHLLTDESRERYRMMKQQAEAWLGENGVSHHAAALLPSDEYADASHPLADGYARLAREVSADEEFQTWLDDGGYLR